MTHQAQGPKRWVMAGMAALYCALLPLYAQPSEQSIFMKVIEHDTRQPIPGAVIKYGADRHCITNLDGLATLHIARQAEYVPISISSLGYVTLHDTIVAPFPSTPFIRALASESIHLGNVDITAQRPISSRTAIASQLSADDLQRNASRSLAAALSSLRGVSMLSGGSNIEKPVVQGMFGNRLRIMVNGVSHEGQQWGNDHAPELDLAAAQQAAVVSGAETLCYGSDALGGVIVLRPRPLPFGKNQNNTSATLYGNSNGWQWGYQMQHGGTFDKQRRWAYTMQTSYRNSGDHRTARYLLNNTGSRQWGASAATGYQCGTFQAEVFYTFYALDAGILPIALGGDIDLLKERIALGRPLMTSPFSRTISYPKQQVQHHTFGTKLRYDLPHVGRFGLLYSHQYDKRDEYQVRRNNLSSIPSVGLTLHVNEFRLDWERTFASTLHTRVGLNGIWSNNVNQSGTGIAPVVPNYTQRVGALYILLRQSKEQWGWEGGLRYDHRRLSSAGYDPFGLRYGGIRHFDVLTGQIGAYFSPSPQWQLRIHTGVNTRAPHVFELYSNGADHASGFFARGDSTLIPETGIKSAASIHYANERLEFTLEGYTQYIRHYIYDQPSGEFITILSGSYPVFQYRSVNALFAGLDLEGRWLFFPGWHYAVTFGMIRATDIARHTALPYMAPWHAGQSLTCKHPFTGAWRRWKAGASLSHRFVSKQNYFDPTADLVPDTPPAYHLLSGELSLDYRSDRGTRYQWALEIDNALNQLYKDYTDRFRYFAHQSGRDIRLRMTVDF